MYYFINWSECAVKNLVPSSNSCRRFIYGCTVCITTFNYGNSKYYGKYPQVNALGPTESYTWILILVDRFLPAIMNAHEVRTIACAVYSIRSSYIRLHTLYANRHLLHAYSELAGSTAQKQELLLCVFVTMQAIYILIVCQNATCNLYLIYFEFTV